MDLAAEGIGFWDWELIEGRLSISDEWLEMMGYERKDIPKFEDPVSVADFFPRAIEIWEKYIHPEDRKQAKQTLMQYVLYPGNKIYNNEFRFLKADGAYVRIFSNGRGEWNKSGRLIRMRVNHVDITSIGSFDRTMLAQLKYMEDQQQDQMKELNARLRGRLRLSIAAIAIFGSLLAYSSGLIDAILTLGETVYVDASNPASVIHSDSAIVSFPAFESNKEKIAEALKEALGPRADRAVFGYYTDTPLPQGRIALQAKRQTVKIDVTKDPWMVDEDPVLRERFDAHLKGQTFVINSALAGLYDAGFQVSAPGLWSRGDGPTIAWFVGIECVPGRICDEDDFDIKKLRNQVREILR